MSVAKSTPKAPAEDGESSQASRAMSLASYFFSGLLGINASQFLGAPLYLINKDWYHAWMAFTKESFGLLTMTMTQSFAPTVMKISGDASVRGQLKKDWNGNLRCTFPDRLVLIANHQIYTDWLYLWWIAYTNGMHGRIHIVLKETLKNIPIIGWGMQFSQFIFMKRDWEKDKPQMAKALQQLNDSSKPMWLLLFPEGTNLSPETRDASKSWAQKTGQKDMQHVLLPRHMGLLFCLQELRQTTDYLYDCTVAYEGVKRGEYAQDVFTLKSSYLEGKPPKSVSMYWRRFPLSKIPLDNERLFERWLKARWEEKDSLLEYFHRMGKFPADTGVEKLPNGTVRAGCGHLEVPLRSTQWYEFLQIFAPMGVLAMVLSVFYGALPKSIINMIVKQAGLPPAVNKMLAESGGKIPANFSLDSILAGDKQEDILKQATTLLLNSLDSPKPNALPAPASTDSMTETVTSFQKALQEEEARRNGKTKTSTPPNSGSISGTFWQNLKDEQSKRNGSVVTLSSQGTAATKISTKSTPNGLTTKKKPLPSSRAASVAGAPVSKVTAPKKTQTTSTTTNTVKRKPVTNPVTNKQSVVANGVAKSAPSAGKPQTKPASNNKPAQTTPPKITPSVKSTPATSNATKKPVASGKVSVNQAKPIKKLGPTSSQSKASTAKS